MLKNSEIQITKETRFFERDEAAEATRKIFLCGGGQVTKWQDQQNFLYFCRQSMREIILVNAWLN
jgi:hypothetical protein